MSIWRISQQAFDLASPVFGLDRLEGSTFGEGARLSKVSLAAVISCTERVPRQGAS